MAGWKRSHLGHSLVPSAEWLLISSWNDFILQIMASVLSQLMVFKNLIISDQIFLCSSMPACHYQIQTFQARLKSDLKRRENPTQSLWITTIALRNRYNDHNGLIEERLADFTASIYCWSYCFHQQHPLSIWTYSVATTTTTDTTITNTITSDPNTLTFHWLQLRSYLDKCKERELFK